jgi:hypothetical protein
MVNAESGFRVVRVLSECRLVDDRGEERMYWRRDGSCLAPGFYVVHWPQGGATGRFNEDALFEGPFRERGGAEAALPRIAACVDAGDPIDEAVPVTERRHLRRPT